jgi:epoxide hydrolase
MKVDITIGCSIFPGEMYRVLKVRAKRVFTNPFYWNEVNRGGHFATYEHQKVWVREMRAHFATMR